MCFVAIMRARLETTSVNSSSHLASSMPDQDEDDSVNCGDTGDHSSQNVSGTGLALGAEGGVGTGDSAAEPSRVWDTSGQVAGGGSGGGGDNERPVNRAGGGAPAGVISGRAGHQIKLLEIGQDVLGRWLDLLAGHGDLVGYFTPIIIQCGGIGKGGGGRGLACNQHICFVATATLVGYEVRHQTIMFGHLVLQHTVFSIIPLVHPSCKRAQ